MIYQTINILLTGIEGLKSMRQPSLRHYSDAYNAVKMEIIVKAADNANRINNAPSRSWVTKISNRFVGNTENLDITAKYSLLEFSDNYSMISGSLWNILEMK